MPVSQAARRVAPETVELPVVGKAPRSHRAPDRRRRRWVAGTFVVSVLVAALGASIDAGLLDSVSMVDPVAARAIEALAAVALVGSWIRRERGWLLWKVPLLLVGTAAVIGGIAWALWATDTVTDAYPVSFGLWAGLVLAALVAAPLALRRPGTVRRIAALVALPLAFTGGLMLIDQEYGVWPQVGDLLGHDHTVDPGSIRQLLQAPNKNAPPPDKGIVVGLDVPTTRSHFAHRPGSVYLPPAYFTAARPNLPVLLMLPGSFGTPAHWAKAGNAVATVDAFAAAHRGVAPVMVFGDENGSSTGDTECVDGPQGLAETYLTTDVADFVTGQLHINRNPGKWGVVGFSEGGTCALDLVLRHPDLYRHIIDLGGDDRPTFGNNQHTLTALFGGSKATQDSYDPARLLAAHPFPGVTAWFAAGTDDPRNLGIARRFAALAHRAGIVTHEFTGIGGHNWQFAGTAFARVLPGLGPELGIA